MNYYDSKVYKINLMCDLPSLEKLCVYMNVFRLLEDGQTLDNLKVLELLFTNDVVVVINVFERVKFTGLQILRMDHCEITIEALEFIDKSAPNLKELKIRTTGLKSNSVNEIKAFLREQANFKNLKFFTMHGEIIRCV